MARLRMSGASRSRWAIDRVFESRTPGMRWQPGFMITAAATTAPQVGATPTSSTPTTRVRPSFQRRRSWRRVGTMTAIGHQGNAGRAPAARVDCRRRRLVVRAALAEGRGLADPLAQEVQLGATNLAVTQDLDLVDPRAVDLERPFHADTGCDPADRDRPGDASAAQSHHDALEDLDALAVALDDLGGDLHGVTRGDLGQVGTELVLDDLVEHVHAAFLD